MDDILISDELYRDTKEIDYKKVIEESESISSKIDEEFVEKVKRIIIKGQIDGS